tara:strand:- start:388 stop:810 length:423 start_codon:yes stop_codon:yes gene_type:complete
MIDKDKLFSLFGGDEEEAKNILETPNTILDNARSKLGMFTKLIYNHEVFHQKLKKFLKEVKSEYDVDKTKDASTFAVYNRAWSYIKDINLKDRSHFDAIVEYKYKPLMDSLVRAIQYFESTEQYERCAVLLKIQKLKNKV